MLPWVVALVVYVAIGIVLVVVGPAARLRRQERDNLEWQAPNHPRWKLAAFSYLLILGITVLWPVLAVSAARTESRSKVDHGPFGFRHKRSAALNRAISDIQKRSSKSLPHDEYNLFASRLRWEDRMQLDARLEQLGYTVTGFARNSDGQNLAVSIPVLELGVPIVLVESRGRAGSLKRPLRHTESEKSPNPFYLSEFPVHLGQFRARPEPDDEVWEFSSSPDSWKHLAGRAGIALVRDTVVIDVCVTVMN